MLVLIIVGFGVIAFIFLIGVIIYNGLISKKNGVENSFSAVDVQLKQRYDLIPNLVESVKKYMKHEQTTLENITRLRSQAMNAPASTSEKLAIERGISKSIGDIMLAVENYPELKADSNFLSLQRSLNEVEAQISAARRTYNAAVTELNNGIEMFPSSIIASFMGLKRALVFTAEETERKNINVGKLFAE
jgi:LemA protein